MTARNILTAATEHWARKESTAARYDMQLLSTYMNCHRVSFHCVALVFFGCLHLFIHSKGSGTNEVHWWNQPTKELDSNSLVEQVNYCNKICLKLADLHEFFGWCCVVLFEHKSPYEGEPRLWRAVWARKNRTALLSSPWIVPRLLGHLHEASRFECVWMAIHKGMITIWLFIDIVMHSLLVCCVQCYAGRAPLQCELPYCLGCAPYHSYQEQLLFLKRFKSYSHCKLVVQTNSWPAGTLSPITHGSWYILMVYRQQNWWQAYNYKRKPWLTCWSWGDGFIYMYNYMRL